MEVFGPQLAEDHRAAQRFLREARIQGQLEHPAIVPVYVSFLAFDFSREVPTTYIPSPLYFWGLTLLLILAVGTTFGAQVDMTRQHHMAVLVPGWVAGQELLVYGIERAEKEAIELARLARRGGYETVVVDTAPTGHALRLLGTDIGGGERLPGANPRSLGFCELGGADQGAKACQPTGEIG